MSIACPLPRYGSRCPCTTAHHCDGASLQYAKRLVQARWICQKQKTLYREVVPGRPAASCIYTPPGVCRVPSAPPAPLTSCKPLPGCHIRTMWTTKIWRGKWCSLLSVLATLMLLSRCAHSTKSSCCCCCLAPSNNLPQQPQAFTLTQLLSVQTRSQAHEHVRVACML